MQLLLLARRQLLQGASLLHLIFLRRQSVHELFFDIRANYESWLGTYTGGLLRRGFNPGVDIALDNGFTPSIIESFGLHKISKNSKGHIGEKSAGARNDSFRPRGISVFPSRELRVWSVSSAILRLRW
jgi:hypothetical protein